MGMSFTFADLGLLIGNPTAGAVLNILQGKFKGAQVFSAVALLAGLVALVRVRTLVAMAKVATKAP